MGTQLEKPFETTKLEFLVTGSRGLTVYSEAMSRCSRDILGANLEDVSDVNIHVRGDSFSVKKDRGKFKCVIDLEEHLGEPHGFILKCGER